MKEPGLAQTLPPLLAGLLIPVYAQTVTGWWLNSGRGVAYTDGALLALAVVFGSVGTGPPVVRLVALWIGAQVGLTAYLFLHEGGSTIFPIVIVVGAIVSAAAVATGGGIGWLIARLAMRWSG